MTEAPAETPAPKETPAHLQSVKAFNAQGEYLYRQLYSPGNFTLDLNSWPHDAIATLIGASPEAFRAGLYCYGPNTADWPRGWHAQARMNLAAAIKGLKNTGREPVGENIIAWLKGQEFTSEEEENQDD